MKKRPLGDWGFRRDSSVQKLRAILRSRVLSSLLRSIFPTFRLLFCRSKASRDVFWLLVEFKANLLLNTRTLPCRTYTIPTHSYGVRMSWLSLMACPLLGVLRIDTCCPLAIGGWSCLSIPISCNWFREIFTVHRLMFLLIGQVYVFLCRYLFIFDQHVERNRRKRLLLLPPVYVREIVDWYLFIWPKSLKMSRSKRSCLINTFRESCTKTYCS